MGIKDLLKNLEGATVQKNISDFSGKRLAIDASGWLHKAVYTIAEDWVDSNCTDSQLYVDVIITRLKQLQTHNITPVMVFDGKRNVLKSETNAKREEGRISAMENARRLLESISNTTDKICKAKMRSECIACIQRGLGATHEMEKNLLAGLHKYNIDVIVAPYEADPQLAYLCHIGYCDGVLSEDSDILVYSAVSGVPFPVLCKFDNKTGAVQVVDMQLCGLIDSAGNGGTGASGSGSSSGESASDGMEDGFLPSADAKSSGSKRKLGSGNGEVAGSKPNGGNFLSQLQTYFRPSGNATREERRRNDQGRRMFVQLCLLSGCDYCDSIPGVGIQTAMQVVVRFRDTSCDLRLKKICDYFKLTGKKVADTYLARVLRAEQLFYFHPVFSPHSEGVVHFCRPVTVTGGSGSGGDRGDGGDGGGGWGGCGSGDSSGGDQGAVPPITEPELQRLGADSREVLAISRREGVSASFNSEFDPHISVRDVCKGHYSIKDHTAILPRYPWETLQNGRWVSTRADGKTTGWYQRRALMSAVSQQQNGGFYGAAAAARGTKASAHTEVVQGRALVSSFMLPQTNPRMVTHSTTTNVKSASTLLFPSTASELNAVPSPPSRRQAITSAYFTSSTSSSANGIKFVGASKVVHKFDAFENLTASPPVRSPPSGRPAQPAQTVRTAVAVSTTLQQADLFQASEEAMLVEDVYDLVEDSQQSPPAKPSHTSSAVDLTSPITVRHGTSRGTDTNICGGAVQQSGVVVMPEPEAPTVYDVLDSPEAVRSPAGFGVYALRPADASNGVQGMTVGVPVLVGDLEGEMVAPPITPTGVVKGSIHTAVKAGVKPLQPTATAKKPLNPFRPADSTAAAAAVKRKTLGPAAFIPISRPPLDQGFAKFAAAPAPGTANTTTAVPNNSSGSVSGSGSGNGNGNGNGGVKRKVGGTGGGPAVAVGPRKKSASAGGGGTGAGSVPSIKAFFTVA